MSLDYIILGGGSRSIKIKISPEIFHSVPNAQIVEGLAGE
jgi:prolyl-tRNA editing enzyme YbaK/EbsC (Cys-tRNA(Pro) deacylase)